MRRIFTLAAGAVTAAASLTLSTADAMAAPPPAAAAKATAPAATAAAPGSVRAVIEHGSYQAVVYCPSWNGPAGGPASLLGDALTTHTPPGPRGTAQRATYTPITSCLVTFLKGTPFTPQATKPGTPVGITETEAVCPPGSRQVRGSASACAPLNTGFGGMAPLVSRHQPIRPAHLSFRGRSARP